MTGFCKLPNYTLTAAFGSFILTGEPVGLAADRLPDPSLEGMGLKIPRVPEESTDFNVRTRRSIDALRTALTNVSDGAITTQTNGSSSLGSTFNMASGTFADSGLFVDLPEAGIYLISADIRGIILLASGTNGYLSAELYNATASANIGGSERLVVWAETTVQREATVSMNWIISVVAASTIKLYGARRGGTTWTTASFNSDTDGRTTMTYIQLRKGN